MPLLSSLLSMAWIVRVSPRGIFEIACVNDATLSGITVIRVLLFTRNLEKWIMSTINLFGGNYGRDWLKVTILSTYLYAFKNRKPVKNII